MGIGARWSPNLRRIEVVGVIEQRLYANEQVLDCQRGLPRLVGVEEREADLARGIDIGVEEGLVLRRHQGELAYRRLVRVLFRELPGNHPIRSRVSHGERRGPGG